MNNHFLQAGWERHSWKPQMGEFREQACTAHQETSFETTAPIPRQYQGFENQNTLGIFPVNEQTQINLNGISVPHMLLHPLGGRSDALCLGDVQDHRLQPVWCLVPQLLGPLLRQTRSQDPQASQVQLLGQEVPKAWVTACDEDELVLEVAHHLPLPVPAQEVVEAPEDRQVQPHGFAEDSV